MLLVARQWHFRIRRWAPVSALPAILWLVVFVLLPLLTLLVVSMWESDLYGLHPIWTLRQWRRIVESPLYIQLLLKTLRISVEATTISLIVAYPVALFLSQLSEAKKRIAVVAFFIPFWVGFVVRTFAWLPILGRHGLVNQVLMSSHLINEPVGAFLYNEAAVCFGLVNGYLLFMVLPIYLSLDAIDPALREAATDLGATPKDLFRYILFPLSLPGVASGCVMVLLLSFGAYVTPALLGGPSGIMFSNVIAQQFTADNNWAFGACLSLLMTLVVAGAIFTLGRRAGLEHFLMPTEPR
jgi:ABC-type spermidine/putrescine transport system permease subunit I